MILQMTRPVQAGLRQERKAEIISQNLANATTSGYKKDIISFDEKLLEEYSRFDKNAKRPEKFHYDKRLNARVTTDQVQGDLVKTDNKLDFALFDEGFFKIQTARGIRYTRDGNFSLNTNGEIVTKNGDIVLGQGGPIAINGNNFEVNEQGDVLVDGEMVDRMQVVSFENLEPLHKEGSSLYIYKANNPEILPQNISVKQGFLEEANVSSVTEMTKMIETHRYFESYQKMIQTLDDIESKLITGVGAP